MHQQGYIYKSRYSSRRRRFRKGLFTVLCSVVFFYFGIFGFWVNFGISQNIVHTQGVIIYRPVDSSVKKNQFSRVFKSFVEYKDSEGSVRVIPCEFFGSASGKKISVIYDKNKPYHAFVANKIPTRTYIVYSGLVGLGAVLLWMALKFFRGTRHLVRVDSNGDPIL